MDIRQILIDCCNAWSKHNKGKGPEGKDIYATFKEFEDEGYYSVSITIREGYPGYDMDEDYINSFFYYLHKSQIKKKDIEKFKEMKLISLLTDIIQAGMSYSYKTSIIKQV